MSDLRILYLEASPEDAARTIATLERTGVAAQTDITSDKDEFARLLAESDYDVILSNSDLGTWGAQEALKVLNQVEGHPPLILVSRYLGEDTAVELLSRGAVDVVYQDRLAVLPFAVHRAIQEKRLRRARTRAELALHSANQVLTALIRCAPLPITVIDEEGRVDVWNPAAEEVLGWGKDEMLGRTLRHVLSDGNGLAELLERSLRQGGVIGAETSQVRKDGAMVDLRVFCSPLTDENERVRGVVGMLTDITERNLIIEAFRESKERFQSAFVYAPIGMAISSLDGRILRVNAAFRQMLGYSEADLLRLSKLDLAHPDDQKLLTAESDEASAQLELRLRHKEGTPVYVQWNTSLVRAADGNPQYKICQVVDITERKSAEERIRRYANDLERSNRDLQHFAYVASHDLQEPLRMVRGFVELLARRYEGRLGADADEYISYAVDGATRMQNLIRGLLAYSRVGTQGKQIAPVDTATALDHALLNLQMTIEEHQVVVTHDPLPVLPADDMQLALLFQNLVGNAVKFRSEKPPRIHISAGDRGGLWQFAVSDNGIGFDPQHADRIFQMFQRLHGQGKYAGTGIGLALCKRIVERHGGTIWVDSAPGKGATFSFTLPKEASIAA